MSADSRYTFDLAAPCGLYCGSCRQYLAKREGLLKKTGLKQGCDGCRIRDKTCTFIKRDCISLRKKELDFCFECKDYPCDNLNALDSIYRSHFYTKPDRQSGKDQTNRHGTMGD